MNILNKLPNSRRHAAGLEWVVLKKLPAVLLVGTLLPLFISLAMRFFPQDGTSSEIAKQVKLVDIMTIATVATVWMSVFTVAIGCCVVVIMKGPAYVADAYEVPDSDRPDS
ncbi:MAG: hypothetical protein WBN57_09770 [Gammaproteobacteria bacterium]